MEKRRAEQSRGGRCEGMFSKTSQACSYSTSQEGLRPEAGPRGMTSCVTRRGRNMLASANGLETLTGRPVREGAGARCLYPQARYFIYIYFSLEL